MKFLTDAMLGRLTRLLRIFGYDTIYAEDIEHSAPDDLLLEYAIKHERIVITKDYPFFRKAGDERAFFLGGKGVYNYLSQLKKEFDLNFNFHMRDARCSVCNSPLTKVTHKESIKGHVKEGTFEHYEEFYRCLNPDCGKIYWRGSHIDDIIEKINKSSQNE